MEDPFVHLPYMALVAAMVVMAASAVLLTVTRYFDRTGGPLIISIVIVVAFVTACYASMIYEIKTTPLTEILVGSLATALGGVMAHYFGTSKSPPPAEQPPDPEEQPEPYDPFVDEEKPEKDGGEG